MKTDEQLLTAAMMPWGAPRFYPSNEHPSTAQLRERIAALEAMSQSEERDNALEYNRATLAKFEAAENRQKRAYLSHARGAANSQERTQT